MDTKIKENGDLIAHIKELRGVIQWMVALIDGGEEMPKPGDPIHEAMELCIINTKDYAEKLELELRELVHKLSAKYERKTK